MIEIKNLTFSYPDGCRALQNIHLAVEKGCRAAVVGANGAGKSSLLSLLVGVQLPQAGEIYMDKIPVTQNTLHEIRKKVGMVFQNPDDQLFMTKVYDDVAFGPRNCDLSPADVEKRVQAALAALGIGHLKNRMPHRLSGGEKRSVALAGVLAMKPEILLLDEPSSFLDPKARRALIGTLSKLPQTMLVATHDLDLVLDLCDFVVILKKGEVFKTGDPKTLLFDETLMEKAGLELPLCFRK